MKKIYVIQTDKPSRLVIIENNDFILLNRYEPNWIETNFNTTNQHINITSDEEIKEGNWFICNNIIQKCNFLGIYNRLRFLVDDLGYQHYIKFCKKIILTTDQDLIKDGVQAIDDEFLEWFVKNPSCEEVEVMFACRGIDVLIGKIIGQYKIIIPKEEPKQEKIDFVYWLMDNCELITDSETQENVLWRYDSEDYTVEGLFKVFVDFSNPNADKISSASTTTIKQETVFENAKLILRKHILKNKEQVIKDLDEMRKLSNEQEILEEVAKKYVNSFEFGIAHPRRVCKNAFINGAKWQQERSYSEEEVIAFGEFIFKNSLLTHTRGVKSLFEQFKNK